MIIDPHKIYHENGIPFKYVYCGFERKLITRGGDKGKTVIRNLYRKEFNVKENRCTTSLTY